MEIRYNISHPFVQIKVAKCHGKGAFAGAFIPKGTKIIQYVGEKITSGEGERRIQASEDLGRKNGDHGAFYIFELNKRYDIDGSVDWNTAGILNHSCSPNCESETIRGKIWISAKRNIEIGEEFTYDYGFGFDKEETFGVPCKCGSDNCIGYILDKKEWPKLNKFLAKQNK
jgi:uncharacterized protein